MRVLCSGFMDGVGGPKQPNGGGGRYVLFTSGPIVNTFPHFLRGFTGTLFVFFYYTGGQWVVHYNVACQCITFVVEGHVLGATKGFTDRNIGDPD